MNPEGCTKNIQWGNDQIEQRDVYEEVSYIVPCCHNLQRILYSVYDDDGDERRQTYLQATLHRERHGLESAVSMLKKIQTLDTSPLEPALCYNVLQQHLHRYPCDEQDDEDENWPDPNDEIRTFKS